MSYNVVTYGAVGNGTTDDRAAIQSAIDAAETAGGGEVYFPKGTYKVTRNGATTYALLAKSNVTLVGDGRGVSIVKLASSTANSVRILHISGKSKIGVRDLAFDGNYAGQSGTIDQQHAVFCDDSSVVTFDRVEFKGTGGDGILVSGSGNCDNITVTNSNFLTNQRNGITLYNGYNNVRILNNHFAASVAVTPIDSEPDSGTNGKVQIIGNVIDTRPANTDAIEIGGVSNANPTTQWEVVGNDIGGSVRITYASYVSITGNRIVGSLDAGIYANSYNTHLTITGNRIITADMSAIVLIYTLSYAPSNVVVSGNVIEVTGTGVDAVVSRGTNHVNITANIIIGASDSGAGIYVWATNNMLYQVLTSNLIRGGFAYGIYVENYDSHTLDGLMIDANMIECDAGNAATFIATGTWLTGLTIGAHCHAAGVTVGLSTDRNYITNGTPDGRADWVCTGTPQSVITAPVGSTARRTDGGTSTTFYVKESGTGNTGWVAK